MISNRILPTAIAAMMALACAAPAAWADRDGDRDDRGGGRQHTQEPRGNHRGEPQKAPRAVAPRETSREVHREQRRSSPAEEQRRTQYRDSQRTAAPQPVLPREARRPPPPPPAPGYVLDRRHHHNHYYPPRGHVVPVLPPQHRVIHYHGTRYYYHSGIWYRPSGPSWVVVVPPIGIVVPILPAFYTTIWWGGIPYYYAGGVYYTWYPEYNGYVVTQPPPEAQVQEAEAISDELFVYPKKGQSEKQQSLDRYECHRWAAGQTGFDPTQPGGGVDEAQNATKRTEYRRAMKACLEARDYSVQ